MFTKYCKPMGVAATVALLMQSAPVFAQSYGTSNQAANFAGTPALTDSMHGTFVPAGMSLSAALTTSISTDNARPGDVIQANLTEPIQLADGSIPAGSVLEGRVVEAKAGGFMGRAGRLTVKFNKLRTPNGTTVPLSASIVGDLGKFEQLSDGSGSFAGEGAGTKAGQALMRTAIGAGAGAALGTAVGAIAGRGNRTVNYRPAYARYGHGMVPVGYYPSYGSGAARGAGRGAWSGAAIGGGLGLADSLLLRKGRNVVLSSGTPLQLRLDAPINLTQPPRQYGNT